MSGMIKLSDMNSEMLVQHREACLADIYDGKGIYVSDEDFEHKEKMFRQVAICERILKERNVEIDVFFDGSVVHDITHGSRFTLQRNCKLI